MRKSALSFYSGYLAVQKERTRAIREGVRRLSEGELIEADERLNRTSMFYNTDFLRNLREQPVHLTNREFEAVRSVLGIEDPVLSITPTFASPKEESYWLREAGVGREGKESAAMTYILVDALRLLDCRVREQRRVA
jgi:hypothetical protein